MYLIKKTKQANNASNTYTKTCFDVNKTFPETFWIDGIRNNQIIV